MFIIIQYIDITYYNINLVGEDGIPTLFGSEHTAEQYAKENCRAYSYKIAKL